MARNVDDFITPIEHSAIDHTGLPGIGGGGGQTVVGADVLEVDVNFFTGTGAAPAKTIPANTLTSDNQSIWIKYSGSGGSGAASTVTATFAGTTILSGTAVNAGEFYLLDVYIVRTGAMTAQATVRMNYTSGVIDLEIDDGFAADWSTALNFQVTMTGGTNEEHRFYQALKWPNAGSIGLTGIGSDTLPTGTIVPYGGSTASVPVGFLPCDGSLYDSTIETELFSVIGTIWNIGGEPGGFFRVPDLRGKGVLGLNDGTLPAGVDGGFTTRTLATLGGSEDHSHGTTTNGDHSHTVNNHTHTISSDGAHTHGTGGAGGTIPLDGSRITDSAGSHNHTGLTGGTGGGTNTTGDHSHTAQTAADNSMQPFAVCAYIIKSQQVGGGVGVTAQNNGGALTGTQPTLNFIPSGIAGVTVVEDGGNNRLDITISATEAFDSAAHASTDHLGIMGVGKILQRVRTTLTGISSTTATIPYNSSIPLTSAGSLLTSLAITPIDPNSTIWVRAGVLIGSTSINAAVTVYLTGDANVRNVCPLGTSNSGSWYELALLEYEHTGFASTATQTWRWNYGANSGTVYLNTNSGSAGTNLYGALPKSWFELIEIAS
jgi:microcystin-dependent protein